MEVNPDLVLKHTKPTEGFLCPVSANIYGITFQSFGIRDHKTKAILFHTGTDGEDKIEVDIDPTESEENMYRKIRYTFPEDVLKIPRMETSLTFTVGDNPLPSFRMIERHYFQDQLIKSYDFNFAFVIPNSTNTWDAVYEIPPLPPLLIEEIIRNPFKCKSDTFYFVGEELVMHHKVSYKYTSTEREQGIHADAKQDSYSVHDESKDLIHTLRNVKFSEHEGEELESEAKPETSIKVPDSKERWSKE